jgi:hypothetical protein
MGNMLESDSSSNSDIENSDGKCLLNFFFVY